MTIRDIGDRYGLRNLRFSRDSVANPLLGVPVAGAGGAVVGHLLADAYLPGSELLPDLALIALAALLVVGLGFAALQKRLRRLAQELIKEEEIARRLATHDHLSGVLNRMSFDSRLSQEIARAGAAKAVSHCISST